MSEHGNRRVRGDGMQQERKPRKAERLKHRAMARFQAQGKEQTGFVMNLSEVGLFIQTRHLLKTGSEIQVCLAADKGQNFELRGKVAYSKQALPTTMSANPGGIGISLIDPPEAYVRYVASLKA